MAGALQGPSGAGGNGQYVNLFSISISHEYYNTAALNACPDFAVEPTSEAARLMAGLGMVFRDLGAGFVVAIPRGRIPALLSFLAPQAGGQDRTWARLSFLLRCKNPAFVNFTRIPITTNPLLQNLYASNLSARPVDGQWQFGGTAGPKLQPLAGGQLTIANPDDKAAVLIDLSGTPVPVSARSANGITSFAMAGLPYGTYQPMLAGEQPAAASLHVPGGSSSFALIDLVLAQPGPSIGNPALFPVQRGAAGGTGTDLGAGPVSPVELTLRFRSRRTYWNYFICSHQSESEFGADLNIVGADMQFTRSKRQLPNGDQAELFAAQRVLPLQQVSTVKFELNGKRQSGNGARDVVRIRHLPVAGSSPVWPGPVGRPLSGTSEIYVYI